MAATVAQDPFGVSPDSEEWREIAEREFQNHGDG
jgi:hypothetical protein